MSKRTIVGIILAIIAVICFVAAARMPGEGLEPALCGVITFPFIWYAFKGGKNKKDDK